MFQGYYKGIMCGPSPAVPSTFTSGKNTPLYMYAECVDTRICLRGLQFKKFRHLEEDVDNVEVDSAIYDVGPYKNLWDPFNHSSTKVYLDTETSQQKSMTIS